MYVYVRVSNHLKLDGQLWAVIWCSQLNMCPVEEQPMLFNPESPLQSWLFFSPIFTKCICSWRIRSLFRNVIWSVIRRKCQVMYKRVKFKIPTLIFSKPSQESIPWRKTVWGFPSQHSSKYTFISSSLLPGAIRYPQLCCLASWAWAVGTNWQEAVTVFW